MEFLSSMSEDDGDGDHDDHDDGDHDGEELLWGNCIGACVGELYSSYPSDPPDPMAAYEELYRGKCGCDTAACDEHELESVKEYIGPLCCNPDFVNVSSLLANDDCTDA